MISEKFINISIEEDTKILSGKVEKNVNRGYCDICGKLVDDIIEVKVDGKILNVCTFCAEAKGYEEYDGSDYGSDWN